MKPGPEQFKDWLRRRHLNQGEAAKHFGWQESFISQLVNGKRTPGLENAITIERETGIPVEAWLVIEVHDSEAGEPAAAVNTNNHKV